MVALGRLGWPLRRIEDATGVRRETASAYLKAAGLPVRAGRVGPTADPKTGQCGVDRLCERSDGKTGQRGVPGSARAPAWPLRPGRSPQASVREPFRGVIVEALSRGRNPSRCYLNWTRPWVSWGGRTRSALTDDVHISHHVPRWNVTLQRPTKRVPPSRSELQL